MSYDHDREGGATLAAIETAKHLFESEGLTDKQVVISPTVEGGLLLRWFDSGLEDFRQFLISPTGYGELS